MPRQARELSQTGIYHIVLRGINQQQIFEYEEDCEKYLELLREYKAISGYSILAYCLMGNHIHLLLKVGNEDLSQIFKRLGGKYVYWYNAKYKRTGHLFQDRFKSEAVNDDAYLLTVMRYIHQNPVKAGLVDKPELYLWTSYREYLTEQGSPITDTEYILSMIDRKEFTRFSRIMENTQCLDVTDSRLRLTDEQAKQRIYKVSGCETVAQFQSQDIALRDKALRQLRKEGLSVRQASRLTGISKGIVEKHFKT